MVGLQQSQSTVIRTIHIRKQLTHAIFWAEEVRILKRRTRPTIIYYDNLQTATLEHLCISRGWKLESSKRRVNYGATKKEVAPAQHFN